MSDKLKAFIGVAVSAAVFLSLGFAFDRSLFRFVVLGSEEYQSEEKPLITAAVRSYNAIFADIHATGGMAKMLNVFPATKSVRHGLFRDIGFIRDSGRILVYDLASLSPIDVRVLSPTTAEAVFLEEWNFVYQQTQDRKPISRIRGMGQGFKYTLVKEHGAWMVNAWDPIDIEETRGTGTSPSS